MAAASAAVFSSMAQGGPRERPALVNISADAYANRCCRQADAFLCDAAFVSVTELIPATLLSLSASYIHPPEPKGSFYW